MLCIPLIISFDCMQRIRIIGWFVVVVLFFSFSSLCYSIISLVGLLCVFFSSTACALCCYYLVFFFFSFALFGGFSYCPYIHHRLQCVLASLAILLSCFRQRPAYEQNEREIKSKWRSASMRVCHVIVSFRVFFLMVGIILIFVSFVGCVVQFY